jgi:hypothetical protein
VLGLPLKEETNIKSIPNSKEDRDVLVTRNHPDSDSKTIVPKRGGTSNNTFPNNDNFKA